MRRFTTKDRLLAMLLAATTLAAPALARAETARPLSEADTTAVIQWIAGRVATKHQSYCYRQTVARDAGSVPNTCPEGTELSGLVCYPPCKAGYDGVGPNCWQDCPDGYISAGVTCHIDKPLAVKGTWTCTKQKGALCLARKLQCPAGYHNGGLVCALDEPSLPPGYTGATGYDLEKHTYVRSAGTILKCPPGKTGDNGLCYGPCPDGYGGAGPVCWQNCKQPMKPCGGGCAKSTGSCAGTTVNMVIAPVMFALFVAALIFTGGAGDVALVGVGDAAKQGVAMGSAGARIAAGMSERAAIGLVDRAALKLFGTTSLDAAASVTLGRLKDGVRTLFQTVTDSKTMAKIIREAWVDYSRAQRAAAREMAGGKAVVRKGPEGFFETAKFYATVVKDVGSLSYSAVRLALLLKVFVEQAVQNFEKMTTQEVVSQLKRNFDGHPEAEQWVKEQYVLQNLNLMLGFDAQQMASTALNTIGIIDITGVTGIVSAFNYPVCESHDPFPSVTFPK